MEKFLLVSLFSLLIAAAHGVSGSMMFDNFGMFEELNSLAVDTDEDTEVETSDIASLTSERGGKVLVNIDSFGAAGNGESDDTEVTSFLFSKYSNIFKMHIIVYSNIFMLNMHFKQKITILLV